ncbi:hypothetical protein SH528x_002973 [Novipirellula sp. SH528]|uniref:hypothetical protein n=1 Tax=Novipirellula sp. SH528 TaxID=3454466 RepID=UPI003FA03B43
MNLLPLIALPVFPVFFAGILFVISRISGWNHLAGIYATDVSVRPTHRYCSGTINGVDYSSCLNFAIIDDGFMMVPVFPFAFFHSPLYIRWCDLSDWSVRRRAFRSRLTAIVSAPAPVAIVFPSFIRDYVDENELTR